MVCIQIMIDFIFGNEYSLVSLHLSFLDTERSKECIDFRYNKVFFFLFSIKDFFFGKKRIPILAVNATK